MRWSYLLILLAVALAACQPTTPEQPDRPTPVAPVITNFEECVAAGNPVMESYPRKCTADGTTFTEELDGDDAPGQDDTVCPAVCVEMYELAGGECIFDSCGSGCGPDDVTTFETLAECREAAGMTAEEDTAEPSVVEIDVEMYQWGFDPNPIVVNEGDTVRLTLTSRDVPHGLSIPQFGVQSSPVGPGETETVEFVADTAGEYQFFCNTYCGQGHSGMSGTLVVG